MLRGIIVAFILAVIFWFIGAAAWVADAGAQSPDEITVDTYNYVDVDQNSIHEVPPDYPLNFAMYNAYIYDAGDTLVAKQFLISTGNNWVTYYLFQGNRLVVERVGSCGNTWFYEPDTTASHRVMNVSWMPLNEDCENPVLPLAGVIYLPFTTDR